MNPEKKKLITISIVCVCAIIAMSIAYFTSSSESINNVIKAGTDKLKLVSTDLSIQCLPDENGNTEFNEFPRTVGQLVTDGDGLISIDNNAEDNKYNRKFIESNGQNGILNIAPNFKIQRALIVTNESDLPMNYKIYFRTNPLSTGDLSTAFTFDYTKFSGDFPNQELNENCDMELKIESQTENIAKTIKTIGEESIITLSANSSHIYFVNMGFLATAGSSYRNTGLTLDISLLSAQGDSSGNSNLISISNQKDFEKVLKNNPFGKTILLTNDIEIDIALSATTVFNLDLNGHTLTFKNDGALSVVFPDSHATMDIGSDSGGHIIGANKMNFVGTDNLGVLNWYYEIADEKMPKAEGILVATKKLKGENVTTSSETVSSESTSSETVSSDSTSSETASSSPTSSESTSSDNLDDELIDYNTIKVAEKYSTTDDGTLAIENIEQFKKYCEEDKPYTILINCKIDGIKNIPQYVMKRGYRFIFGKKALLTNLVFIDKESVGRPNNPFPNAKFYDESGLKISNLYLYINDIRYER